MEVVEILSNEAIKNIREALETKISIAFLDETKKKFKKIMKMKKPQILLPARMKNKRNGTDLQWILIK